MVYYTGPKSMGVLLTRLSIHFFGAKHGVQDKDLLFG